MRNQRAALVADRAIDVLVDKGARGLTHRAVDEAAGLSLGSTSNVARTRLALLELALRRLQEREAEILPSDAIDAADLDGLAGLIAEMIHRMTTTHRRLSHARYELALEASRQDELRALYDALGGFSRELSVSLLAAAGSAAPDRQGKAMVAAMDGMVFDSVAGAGETLEPGTLHTTMRELLRGLLGR